MGLGQGEDKEGMRPLGLLQTNTTTQQETLPRIHLALRNLTGVSQTHSPESTPVQKARPVLSIGEAGAGVRTLRPAFLALQATLQQVSWPPSCLQLDVLVLATNYITHLTRTLGQGCPAPWPAFPAWTPLLSQVECQAWGLERRFGMGNTLDSIYISWTI